jgi:ABC-type transport system involved in multi-copper enzyme maturation permease subunit
MRASGRAFRSMNQIFLTGLLSGLRSRGIQAVFFFGVLVVVAAYLSASFSPRHPQTVALDVGFSGGRLSLVLFALLWVQELVVREIDRHSVFFALAYPLDRGQYLLGRYLSILLLLFLATILLAFMLLLIVLFAGGNYQQQYPVLLGIAYWATWAGLFIDAAVVAACGMLLATLSTSAIMPLLVGLVFAVTGKSLGAVLDYLRHGADGDKVIVSNFGPALEFIQWVLPDLSRLDWRTWPMYGQAPTSELVVLGSVMAAGYTLLMLALAMRTFSRREFL